MVNDAGAWSREGREWAASSRVRRKRVNKSRPVLGGFPICNRLAIDQNVRPFCKMCISALVSNSRNGNSAGQPGEELVGCASAVEAEAVFVQVTLEQLTSTMVSSGQEYLQIA